MMSVFRFSLVYMNYFLKKSRKSKVFYLHSIHNNNNFLTNIDDRSTHISKFIEFVDIIKKNGFRIVDEIKNEDNEIQITFDDGYIGIYENMQFFVDNGIKVKVFLSPILFNKKKYMSIKQIVEMSKLSNFIFGSHTMTHVRLDTLNDKQLEFELRESKNIIENAINQKVDSFCFPFGFFNDKVISMCKKIGYVKLYSCIPGNFYKPSKLNIICRSLIDDVSKYYFKCVLFGADEILNFWYFNKHYSK